MAFAHKNLVVYQKSIVVVSSVARTAALTARTDPWLASQMRRAAASIALNIAEGAGEYSKADKARFYRMARRSAFELAAVLDITEQYCRIRRTEFDPIEAPLDEIAAMLTVLVKRLAADATMAQAVHRTSAISPSRSPSPSPSPSP